MPITIVCECGRRFEALEGAGGPARCPDCGREQAAPAVVPANEEPTQVCGEAVASLGLGLLFFLAFISGIPAILMGRRALRKIAQSDGRLRGRRRALAGIVLGAFGCFLTLPLILPAFRSAREAARRVQCANNLKQIGLALRNYHETYGRLPAAAITDKNGGPLLSWRVAILPYLESEELYARFHLDEPWDGPHNLPLLDEMPHFFACPSDKTLKPGMTGYQVVVGAETAFTADYSPVRFQDFADGEDKTILIVESRRAVPWTKPEDLPFASTLPLAGLGSYHGYHNNGFNALFADGYVHFLMKAWIAPGILRALLTRGGSEVISSESY